MQADARGSYFFFAHYIHCIQLQGSGSGIQLEGSGVIGRKLCMTRKQLKRSRAPVVQVQVAVRPLQQASHHHLMVKFLNCRNVGVSGGFVHGFEGVRSNVN